jgi:arylsulfatase A-like enzyme
MHGAHGLFRKGWPYEESVRVPLLVRMPGVAARKDAAAVSLVELRSWMEGWAEGSAAGGPKRGGPGINRPTYARVSMPSVVALPHQCDRVWRGVRTKARKLVLNADGSPWLFFDLERDPLEMKNLAGDPASAEEMAQLKQWV